MWLRNRSLRDADCSLERGAPKTGVSEKGVPAVIVEERIYVLHAHILPAEFLEPYERLGLPIQLRILGGLLGYFVTEIGRQNELTHLWAYQDLEDRHVRRTELAADRNWQECVRIVRPMIYSMTNKIMYPTSFSPIQAVPATA